MSKAEELRILFREWKEKYFPNSPFYEDGIINEELYNQVPEGKRILFIAKEPNATKDDGKYHQSFIEEWNTGKPEYPFACRIAEWAYGIKHDFPVFECIPTPKYEHLKEIAFMNVKKSGGLGSANSKSITKVVNEQKEYISKQIAITDPDIIILCLSFDCSLIKKMFSDLELKPTGYNIEIGRHKECRVINFYHPSSRNAPAAAYSLLQNILLSESFAEI
jgi:hypothetical protein